MKLPLLVCLFAMSLAAHQAQQATAAHQHTAAKADDSTDAADTADTGDNTGYGEEEGYTGETYSHAYATESYATVRVPTICLGKCPRNAPCQNRQTGACSPKYGGVQYAAAGYEEGYTGEASNYEPAQEQSGYRRLSGDNYDAAQEGETYAAGTNYVNAGRGCPGGTRDVWGCSRLDRRVVLWVAFALLLAPALWFFYRAFDRQNGNSLDEETQLHRIAAGGICFIASLAYLCMALGYGYIVRCCDGREFYYARYVDWALTTPMQLWELIHLSNGASSDSEVAFIMAVDVLMIVAGLIGSLVECNNHKWAFWGFGVLCFIPILYFLLGLRNRASDDEQRVYNQIMTITIVTWFFYPIIWIFAEGTGKLCAQGEAIAYTVLDIISKSIFGFIIVNSTRTASKSKNNGNCFNGGNTKPKFFMIGFFPYPLKQANKPAAGL